MCYRYKGETKLEPSERVKLETKASNGDVTSTLTVESLTLEDKADIRVTGKNPAGEVSATAKLNVIGTIYSLYLALVVPWTVHISYVDCSYLTLTPALTLTLTLTPILV